ncbi:F-box-like domain superfamily, partial [Arabidopsis suecica]
MAMDSFRDSNSINNLPDEILGKILSLLPTNVAATTSILSKRWRNLLTHIDSLYFDDAMVVYPNEEEALSGSDRFCDFVDKTFALLSNSHMKKFSLRHVPRLDHYDAYHRWISTALEQERGLLELHLHADPRFKGVFFPALKSLSLLSVSMLNYDNYFRLLDGCPALEVLYIRDAGHFDLPRCGAVVKSSSIKRLVVFVNLPDSKEHHEVSCFEAPSLVYLDYSSFVFGNYQSVDLESLIEARLNLRLWESYNNYGSSDDDGDDYSDYTVHHYYGDVTNLVAGITNITTLHLSPDSLEAIYFLCKSMPVFNNLLNLYIESNKEKGWQVMPLLLKSCPNLHTLVFKGLVHKVTNRCGDACACFPKKQRVIVREQEEVCCLLTCQVKVLEISEYRGSFQELKQVRHFLGKLECLETVKVGVVADTANR